ncbi:hypothetical protein DYB25_005869 [Aphanomyces astaci]|uniref:PIPK domain-containing protein n=1 Tax=Aphanomyces astaci TaxID=112090 RepID=A0A397AN01_APHAT|nr:hypothetical protein DYB25_005869 [Aphanomyces astaci]
MMGRDRMDGLTADALATQVGAIVSASSTTFILVRSLGAKEKQYRRHPNPLLFWKAAVDGVYALQLCAQTLHIRLVPAVLSAALVQSSLYASESWFVLISYDLYACGTNPFQNTAYSIRWYHAIAWSVGGVAGLVSWLCIAPSDRDDIVEHARDVIGATEWTLGLFYIYVTLCVLCACVFLLLENQSRPPVGGIKEALRTRSSMLHASRTFTILYGVYQFVAIVLWVLLTLSSVAASWQVHVAFNGLVGARGFMDLVTWHAINSRSFVLHSPSSSLPVDATNRSVSGGSDSFLDGVMSWNPEFNVALRNEVLHFTTRGIVAASLSTTNTASNQSHNYHRRIQLNLHELGMHLRFDSYYPHLFQDVRRGYRLDEASYRESFMSTCHERVGHGGSSGAFMFYTADYLFLVKTITKAERRVLLKMLPAYIQYLKRHPRTHLTRYYGCHAIHMYRQRFYFVVMSNAMGRSPTVDSFHRSCRYSIHIADDDDDVTTPLAASYRKSSLDFGTFEKSPWMGQRDTTKSGVKASAVVGPDFYTLGIVDLLQTWTWQKRMERWWKVYVLRLDGRGISAAPPAPYAARFQTKMRDILLPHGATATSDMLIEKPNMATCSSSTYAQVDDEYDTSVT